MDSKYDIIVIGAGHAGCEAAYVSATMGASTLLITMDLNKIAQMSCNPSIGGIAKGQIIREIDALGGFSGIITDASSLQFRMLNRSKGPAMWSPRAQCDRMAYSQNWPVGSGEHPQPSHVAGHCFLLQLFPRRIHLFSGDSFGRLLLCQVLYTHCRNLSGRTHIRRRTQRRGWEGGRAIVPRYISSVV